MSATCPDTSIGAEEVAAPPPRDQELGSNDIEGDEEESKGSDGADESPPQRLMMVVMVTMVQGYTLIGPLQHSFKVALHIADTGKVGHIFTQAAAMVQWGKFVMTLAQNFILAPLSPLQRVYLSMALMIAGSLIPPLLVYALGSHWLGWVFFTFGLIGLSLGIFECNFLSVITPLGPLTKSYAIMGFPAAFGIINIIGMTLVSFGMPVQVLFWYIVCAMPFGSALFYYLMRRVTTRGSSVHAADVCTKDASKQATIWRSLREWRSWLVRLFPFMVVNFVGHFVMEGALPATFNTFNARYVPLLGRSSTTYLMNMHRFFVVYFFFVFLGDTSSRRIGYATPLGTYTMNLAALSFGLLCSVVGMYLATLGIGVVSWASAFLAFFGQGFNYAVSSKYIDRFVPKDHNLVGYSFWMFVGAGGAIAGSTMVDVIRYWICHGQTYPFECLSHHR